MQKVQNNARVKVGTAGWSIPANSRTEFPDTGYSLEKYATRFNAVEINSSFYCSHKQSTYQKWALQVPSEFSFSVKLSRSITHDLKLKNIDAPLQRFAEEVSGLGNKLGCVLVQLPPKFQFFKHDMASAFGLLRQTFACAIVCEPRHQTWNSNEVDEFLIGTGVARAAVDPALYPQALVPGGDKHTCYYRLHGSPDMYYSDYDDGRLEDYARLISDQQQNSEVWCIFDNTALGHATINALKMQRLLHVSPV